MDGSKKPKHPDTIGYGVYFGSNDDRNMTAFLVDKYLSSEDAEIIAMLVTLQIILHGPHIQ
jgi:hypothetical protein